ncbi:MAG: ABC transporter permease [Acidimicrobiales bacterium]|nr:MAG: ABC transporter permease [Acidimicrobiales bacterium]
MFGYRLIRRETPLPGGQVAAFLAGLVVALILGAVLLLVADHNPIEIYKRMFDAAFGSSQGWSTTLTRAVPLGLAGLAVAVAGSMGLWNIGAEGQIIAGAIGAAWVARIAPDVSGPALIPAMLIAATVGGAVLALGPALARAYLGVNEIITTLMLNEVAIRIVRYLLNGPWKDPLGNNFPVAPKLPEQAQLPALFERSDVGLLIAGAVIAGFGFFASRSKWGYELKIAGSSEKAAEYVGISLRTKVLTVLVLSGAIEGLAGGIELTSSGNRLVETVANGSGFAGIIVAALALMRPSGVAVVAVAFGALQVGGVAIQTRGVPATISEIIQALVLFGALGAAVFVNYSVRRTARVAPTIEAEATA